MMSFIRTYAKGVVAFLVVVVGGALAQGLIVGATAAWCTVVIGALGTAGVVATKNAPKGADGHVGAADAGLTLLEVTVVGLVIVVFLIVAGYFPAR